MKYNRQMIVERYNRGEELSYVFFWGHTSNPGEINKTCFSQWYPCNFVVDETSYYTTEQYMMAQKALLFNDQEICEKIMSAKGPSEYKKLGRKVRNFDEKVWDENKYRIVLQGNIAKFSQNPELEEFLLGTGDSVLAEASPYDEIWGVKLSMDNELIQNPNNWKGENLLGFALMETRDVLWKEKEVLL